MRIARVQVGSRASFGEVIGEEVHLLAGSPLVGDQARTGRMIPLSKAEFLPPVVPSKILAVGRNYADHAAEMGLEAGSEPTVFMKPPSSLLPHRGTVILPDPELSREVEHEAELAVVIGKPLRNASPEEAARAVFGYTCADDVSARDLQRSDAHIIRAKGFDTFCPVGPWIETEADPYEGLEVRCRVNGETRQVGSTTDLIFDVHFLLSHISRWATLLAGDLVLTGTPAGTGRLDDGDEVEVEIAGVGLLAHHVSAL